MAVLALVVSGGFMFQCMKKNDKEELDEVDEEIEFDSDIDSPPSSSHIYPPAFGTPSHNWDGCDNGHRMRGGVI
ncbi:MAG: hypothetical protein ACI8RD_011761 [Bacillariaceae sp.]|jgi:hypothetical protein